jgi:hypothetical protein
VTPTHRLGPAAIALVIAISPLALSSPAIAAPASHREAAAPVSPTWATYFFPTRVGLTCTNSFVSASASGQETLTIASIKDSPRGKSIVITESGAVQSAGQDIPVNASVHYTLTPDGELINEPSNALVVGQGVHTVGNTILPTVKSLLAGGSSVSTIRESIPLPQSQLAQISPALKANQTGLDVSVSLREKGKAVSALTVPMGTFHHLLEVQTKMQAFHVTNAIPSAEKEIDAAIRPTLSKVLSFSTWYAPGVGPVQVSVASLTTVTKGCSG